MRRGVLLLLIAGGAHPALAADACDRECLNGFVDRYLAALVARDVSRLPLARDVKFTENLVPLQIGTEGLWSTISGRGDFNLYVADTRTGSATWTGVVKENDKPVFMSLRLQIVNGKMTEVETLIGRISLTGADRVGAPRPEFSQVEPTATRSTRAQLIALVDGHWDNMEQGTAARSRYTADCERYDNGHKTTGSQPPLKPGEKPTGPGSIGSFTCEGQMASARFKNGNRVYPRRVWAVDEERGLVAGYYSPNVPGTTRVVQVYGEPYQVGPDELIPFTILQVEVFKIIDGKIARVEVTLGPRVPYGMRSPFDMKTLWQPR